MDVLITYDVNTETKEGKKRLRDVAKVCLNYGQRVQKSVFECSINEVQMEVLINKIVKIIDEETDSVRVYRLVEPRQKYVKVYGIDHYASFNDPLVV